MWSFVKSMFQSSQNAQPHRSSQPHDSSYSIHDAAFAGDCARINQILSKDVTLLYHIDDEGYTPLMNAVIGGHLEAVECLLDYGATGLTGFPLEEGVCIGPRALAKDKPQIYELLDKRGLTDDTFLHDAAFAGDTALIKQIIRENSLDINVLNSNGETALFSALKGGQIKAVKLLIEYGCDPHMLNHQQQTPITFARDILKPDNHIRPMDYKYLKSLYKVGQTEELRLAKSLASMIKNARAQAQKLGKKVLILVGETHDSYAIQRLQKWLFKLAKKQNLNHCYYENPSDEFDTFGFTKKIEQIGYEFQPIDLARNGGKEEVSMSHRDDVMSQEMIKANKSGIAIVGSEHLKGMHERLQGKNYYVMPLCFSKLDKAPFELNNAERQFACNPEHVIQLDRDGSCSDPQAALKDWNKFKK